MFITAGGMLLNVMCCVLVMEGVKCWGPELPIVKAADLNTWHLCRARPRLPS